MKGGGLHRGMLASIVAGCMLFCACSTTGTRGATMIKAQRANVSVETHLKMEYLRTSDGVEIVRNGYVQGKIAGDAVGRFEGGPDMTIGDVVSIEGADYRNTMVLITLDRRVVNHARLPFE